MRSTHRHCQHHCQHHCQRSRKRHHQRHHQRHHGGFTLVECLMVVAIAAVLAGVAVPSMRGHELRTARLDAVQALTRLQGQQENYRAHHGAYTTNLVALGTPAATSAQGRYALSLRLTGADAYQAVATAQGKQGADRVCGAITLDVSMGFATPGPSPACWGR